MGAIHDLQWYKPCGECTSKTSALGHSLQKTKIIFCYTVVAPARRFYQNTVVDKDRTFHSLADAHGLLLCQDMCIASCLYSRSAFWMRSCLCLQSKHAIGEGRLVFFRSCRATDWRMCGAPRLVQTEHGYVLMSGSGMPFSQQERHTHSRPCMFAFSRM